MHPRHNLPGPDFESASWRGFVTSLSARGVEKMTPLIVTAPEGRYPGNEIVDGQSRWVASKQLGWDEVRIERCAEEEAAAIILENLMGQHHYTKGARVYLAIPNMAEFVQSAETRRLRNLKQGVLPGRGTKTMEKALKFPKSSEGSSGALESVEGVCERLGCGPNLYFQAVRIRRLFDKSGEHKFEFQDGTEKTLKRHFEPKILDPEQPMGLGEVLKGCGWFVDENGNPKKQAGPPERNSYLHYFQSAWGNFNKQFDRWEKLGLAGRAKAMELVTEGVSEWPAEVIETVVAAGKKSLTANKR